MIRGSMVPPLSQKVATFTYLGQGLSANSWLFLNFLTNFTSWLSLTKCWLFQTRNPPLSLFLAVLAVVFSQFCPNII